jgi:two-component system NarL family sensor kinase
VELQLLRITQESLTNVRKHASATGAWVGLQADNGTLKLTVGDDGKGFDLGRALTAAGSRLGLESMRERAEAIGAEFDIDSKPGSGTQVTVRLPIKGPS